MRRSCRYGWIVSGSLLVLVGCAGRDYRTLPLPEQELFRAYSQAMTGPQITTYLALDTSAERDAYVRDIGITQRLEALPDEEREAVFAGQVFTGMSAEALTFVWGTPCRTKGPASDAYWYYDGPAFRLPEVGWNCSSQSRYVEVHLVDGKMQWWKERVPSRPMRLRR